MARAACAPPGRPDASGAPALSAAAALVVRFRRNNGRMSKEEKNVVFPANGGEGSSAERRMEAQARKAERQAGAGRMSQYDLGSLIPGKGDPRRPPEWLPRALVMAGAAVFVFIFIWNSWSKISWIVVDLIICVFLSLAMEPMVQWFIRHGWKRGPAAAASWIIVLLVSGGLVWMFGQMFVMQVSGLVDNAPRLYEGLARFVDSHTSYRMPRIADLGPLFMRNLQSSWFANFAGTALSSMESAVTFVISLLLVLFVTYYVMASGPAMRRVMCSWLRPEKQKRFLVVWTVVQGQVSSFLSSRVILGLISVACMSVYMLVMRVPYWLPLCLLYAIISQFIPMVGAGIGAILPIVVAWSNQGFRGALFLGIYIVVYQQLENNLIAPLVQQRTMSVNAAIGLLSVFVFGALFGALGMFLALPATASIQVIFDAYVKRQDLVDSPLLSDPEPKRRSRLAAAGESIKITNVHLPVKLPRAVRGSTVRVMSTEEQLREAARAVEGYVPGTTLDASRTVAIPKRAVGGNSGPKPRGERLENLAGSAAPAASDVGQNGSRRRLWKREAEPADPASGGSAGTASSATAPVAAPVSDPSEAADPSDSAPRATKE